MSLFVMRVVMGTVRPLVNVLSINENTLRYMNRRAINRLHYPRIAASCVLDELWKWIIVDLIILQ